MKCKICGKENQAGAVFIHAETKISDYVCLSCQLESEMAGAKELKDIDANIKMMEGAVDKFKTIVEEVGSMEGEYPPELMAFAPLSVYKIAEEFLATLKIRRMELLLKEDKTIRLKYELQQAIEKEDFEKAAQLKSQLAEEE